MLHGRSTGLASQVLGYRWAAMTYSLPLLLNLPWRRPGQPNLLLSSTVDVATKKGLLRISSLLREFRPAPTSCVCVTATLKIVV